jgi:hypothetical protein
MQSLFHGLLDTAGIKNSVEGRCGYQRTSFAAPVRPLSINIEPGPACECDDPIVRLEPRRLAHFDLFVDSQAQQPSTKRSDKVLLDNELGIFVIAEPDKLCMPKPIRSCPLQKLNLSNGLGTYTLLHFLGGEFVAPNGIYACPAD